MMHTHFRLLGAVADRHVQTRERERWIARCLLEGLKNGVGAVGGEGSDRNSEPSLTGETSVHRENGENHDAEKNGEGGNKGGQVTFCKMVRWKGILEEVGEDWAFKSEFPVVSFSPIAYYFIAVCYPTSMIVLPHNHFLSPSVTLISLSHPLDRLEIHKDIIRRMESYNSWRGTLTPQDEALLVVSREAFEGER